MWLPRKKEEDDSGLDDGIYSHPVVILSPRQSEGLVKVLIITSFGNNPLTARFPYHVRRRLQYLPIVPSSAHPDNNALLRLQDGLVLRRKSYVNTKHQHTLRFSMLAGYRGDGGYGTGLYVLTEESYREVVRYCGYTAEVGPVREIEPAREVGVLAPGPVVCGVEVRRAVTVPDTRRPVVLSDERARIVERLARQEMLSPRRVGTLDTDSLVGSGNGRGWNGSYGTIEVAARSDPYRYPVVPGRSLPYPVTTGAIRRTRRDGRHREQWLPYWLCRIALYAGNVVLFLLVVSVLLYGLYALAVWAIEQAESGIEVVKGAVKSAWEWVVSHLRIPRVGGSALL